MRSVISICVALVLLVCLANSVHADIVVPNSAAGVEADGTFALTSTTTGRTFQLTIAANQLSSIIGQELTGLQFRLNGAAAANWPGVDTNYSFFDIFIGPGVAPSAMSNTFASNFSGTATQVRSGGLTLPANSFSFGGSPNAFGTSIMFNSGYMYTGGDLTVEMRFSAQSGATNQPSFDAVLASGGPGNGWGVDFAGRWTGNAAGVTGANGNFLVTNFHTNAIPEPTSAGLLAAGFFGFLLRRKR